MPNRAVLNVPNYRRMILLLLSFAIMLNVFSQTHTPITTYISPDIGGYWEYLPADYKTTTKTYPLMVFFHGKGDRGTGSQTDLQLVLRAGPPKVITGGLFPKTITSGGKSYSFIVISPQLRDTVIGVPQDFNILMSYIRHHYRIDESRIYLSGLSLGAGRILYCASSSLSNANSTAAMVSASTDWSGDTLQSTNIAVANVPLWFATNTQDPTVPYTHTLWWYDFLTSYRPAMNPQPLLDTFVVQGHDSWTKLFDPSFRPRGLNVYEWLLLWSRGIDTAKTHVYPYISVPDTVALPVKSITLDGRASSTDSGALLVSYQWKVLSGPAGYQLSNSTSSVASLSKLSIGKYTIQLTVSNNKEASSSTNAVIVAVQGPNPLAVAHASPSITLPVDSVTLDGSASYDPLGVIVSYAWSCISGTPGYVFSSTTTRTVQVNKLTGGVYDFVLTVANNKGYKSRDTVSVLVKNTAVSGPVAVIRNPGLVTGTSAMLDASASYTAAGRAISAFTWNYISGPKNYIIQGPASAITKVNNLVNGTYTFQVKVADPKGSGSGRVTFTVNLAAANVMAVINGPTSITADSVFLDGTFSSSSNGPLTYAWSVISGPVGYVLNSTTAPMVKITKLTTGTYAVRLAVRNSNGLQDSDTISIVVKAPTVKAIINAPASITLPVDSVALDGRSSTSSNGGLTYKWKVISGPTGYVLSSTTASVLKVTKMSAGTFLLALTVKNGTGQQDSTTATVVVNPAAATGPVAVIADPGPVTTSTVTLDASGSYTVPGRTITSYLWNYMAGPKNAIIQSPNSAITTVSNLTNGTYTYRVKVTDKSGSNSQSVTFTVKIPSAQRIATTKERYQGEAISDTDNNISQPLKLSPVPANDYLNLSVINDVKGKVIVYITDVSGRILFGQNCVEKNNSRWSEKINITSLTGGLYFVTLVVGNEKISGRFIKLAK